ncbi:MAG: nuclear transport factor 2 family protein [Opitutales bacterium]|nr:nuclear transport factor 2 family protein [Opitutales bacterium]
MEIRFLSRKLDINNLVSRRLIEPTALDTLEFLGKSSSRKNDLQQYMAKEPVETIDSTKPQTLYQAWIGALESRDIDRVLDLYDRNDSALWGTLANELKIGRDAIRTYFDSFLDRSSLAIETLNIFYRQPSKTIVLANGAYAFRLGGLSESDPITKIQARFSFVFRKSIDCEDWQILEHHSSKFPG